MSDSGSERERRRWITLGELIALAALIVSGIGVWINWKSSGNDKPAPAIEQPSAIPLALRGIVNSDGSTLTFVPADSRHALESLVVTVKGGSPIEVGSDGKLAASDVESALTNRDKQPKDVALSVPVNIKARYVEAGVERRGGGAYTLRYKWEGGGLFGGRSLHLIGLMR